MTDRDIEWLEAVMKLLVEEGHMTPMAVMQIRKIYDGRERPLN